MYRAFSTCKLRTSWAPSRGRGEQAGAAAMPWMSRPGISLCRAATPLPQPQHIGLTPAGPQGALALEQLQCLRSTGFEFATFECWVERGYGMFWEECVGNIARAQIAGLKVGAYMFPHRSADATLQVQQLVGNLSAFNVSGTNAQNKRVLALLPIFLFLFTGDRRAPNHDRHRKRHFAHMVQFLLERKSSIRAAAAWRDRGRGLRRHSASGCLTRFCCIASAATQCA